MTAMLLLAGILHYLAAARPLYLVVWSVLAVVSAVLVVSMRSRWGRKNPLYRCAVASLLVHVLLVGLTMMVRLVVGDGGAGAGPPIHVKLVDDVEIEGPITVDAAPPLLAEDAAAEEAKPPSDEVAEDAVRVEPVEPPPLLAPPEPAAEKKIVMDEAADAPPQEAVTPKEICAGTGDADRGRSAGCGPAGGRQILHRRRWWPAAFRRRRVLTRCATRTDRLEYAERHGGSVETEAAVAAALKWLADRQSADGRWDASRFGAGIEQAVLGQDRGGAGADADTGISALALLAFMGAGHSHHGGPVPGDGRPRA